MTLNEIGSRAREVLRVLGTLGSRGKNMGLEETARALLKGEGRILKANSRDYEKARFDGMSQGLLDRPKPTPVRVQATVDGLLQAATLEDPVGEVLSMKFHPNGLQIGRRHVPLGVIGMICEVYPSVTADALNFCFKSGNAVILKGGGDALHSNTTIARCLHAGFSNAGLPEDSVQLIEDTSRDTTRELVRLDRYIGVLTSRGGAGLIEIVVKNNTIPVIETGTDNCRVYVDASADQNMALDIIFNAKVQRVGVCNVCESLLVHKNIAEEFPSLLRKKLGEKQVEIRGDEDAYTTESSLVRTTEGDWGRERLDRTLSLKLVDSVDEVIRHVNTYNTGHSETIVTSDYFSAQRFLNEVNAAVVCVNASIRFMGGEELGFGAEIDISAQRLHARSPMGLRELTTVKYIIYGDGQIR